MSNVSGTVRISGAQDVNVKNTSSDPVPVTVSNPITSWYSGAGVPSGGLGGVGDYYLDTSNGDVYTKAVTGWGIPIDNITGPVGPTGAASTWYTGAGVPGVGLGADGDMYLDTSNGDVYQKVAGSWGVPIENIAGVPGPNTVTTSTTTNITGVLSGNGTNVLAALASANTVLAGPTSGGATQAVFRTLVGDDIPSLTNVVTFSSSGFWTCPVGVTSVIVWGRPGAGGGAGGGGGGGGYSGASGGGGAGARGGGAGGAASFTRVKLSVIPTTVYTITIGAGGTGGNGGAGGAAGINGNGGVSGNIGGASSFGSLITFARAATIVGASGGTGGGGGAQGTALAGGVGSGASTGGTSYGLDSISPTTSGPGGSGGAPGATGATGVAGQQLISTLYGFASSAASGGIGGSGNGGVSGGGGGGSAGGSTGGLGTEYDFIGTGVPTGGTAGNGGNGGAGNAAGTGVAGVGGGVGVIGTAGRGGGPGGGGGGGGSGITGGAGGNGGNGAAGSNGLIVVIYDK